MALAWQHFRAGLPLCAQRAVQAHAAKMGWGIPVRCPNRLPHRMALAAMLLLVSAAVANAQNYSPYQGYTPYAMPYAPPPAPVAPAPPIAPGPPVFATPQIVAPLTIGQIDQLVAPIALYPDPLLAQLLPASTYPEEVALAAQWLQYNPAPSEILIDTQNWDASIKALVHYPTVLAYMNANMAWTQALGVAFLNQQAEVMQAIQQLRAQAIAAGTLQSTPQQQVINENGVIWIEPVSPQIIYVPQYDPSLVYVRQQVYNPGLLVTFGIGFAIGGWLDNDCDWRNHWVSVGPGWRDDWRRDQHGRWIRQEHNDHGYQGHFGPVPARPIPQRWRRDARQPLPALPSNMAPRGALRQYRGWPAQQPTYRPPAFVQPGGHRPQPMPRMPVQPTRMFGGNYRSNNNVIRETNRGRRSIQQFQAHQYRGAENHAMPRAQYRAPAHAPERQSPSAFRGMNSGRSVQQDSRRGQQSMGRKR